MSIRYKAIQPIIRNGLYYRLSNVSDSTHYVAWQFVSPDKTQSLLNIVVTNPQGNSVPVHIRLKGLDGKSVYSVDGEFECSGYALMNVGYTFEQLIGDYPSRQIDIVKVR